MDSAEWTALVVFLAAVVVISVILVVNLLRLPKDDDE